MSAEIKRTSSATQRMRFAVAFAGRSGRRMARVKPQVRYSRTQDQY